MTQVPCPQCREMTQWKDNAFRPFCSERCKLIDLGQWANEGYSIKGEAAEPQLNSNQHDGDDFMDNVIPFPQRNS